MKTPTPRSLLQPEIDALKENFHVFMDGMEKEIEQISATTFLSTLTSLSTALEKFQKYLKHKHEELTIYPSDFDPLSDIDEDREVYYQLYGVERTEDDEGY
jgi:arginyl-tRNA--protein-N-Asp/Glu arginylyltransferase